MDRGGRGKIRESHPLCRFGAYVFICTQVNLTSQRLSRFQWRPHERRAVLLGAAVVAQVAQPGRLRVEQRAHRGAPQTLRRHLLP